MQMQMSDYLLSMDPVAKKRYLKRLEVLGQQNTLKPNQTCPPVPQTNQINQPNNAYPMFHFPGKGQPIMVTV